MATKKGTTESEGYNLLPIIPGNKKVWFLNGDLVRVHHFNKSNGIMSVYNITKDQIESCLINEFKKRVSFSLKVAFSFTNASRSCSTATKALLLFSF